MIDAALTALETRPRAQPSNEAQDEALQALLSPPARARVHRVCTAIVRDPVAAEDLTQETLLVAWRLRHRLIDPTGATVWLDAIARNVCRQWLRRRSRAATPMEVAAMEVAATEVAAADPDDVEVVLEREELAELLDRALAMLPAHTRSTLVARYVEERTPTEIAVDMGISADAVSMRLHRGKLRLRHLLETEFRDDAVAEGWVRRSETGWSPTRLRCPTCGRSTVTFRREPADAAVAFRCTGCDPTGLSLRFPLDNPVFNRLVGRLRRPSAILEKASEWSWGYWAPRLEPRTVTCTRCGRTLPVRRFVRPTERSWAVRHGWYVDCDRCGEEVCGSVAGVALALPEVRAARKRSPRLVGLPAREVVRHGEAAMVLPFVEPNGPEQLCVVFSRERHRLREVLLSGFSGRSNVPDTITPAG